MPDKTIRKTFSALKGLPTGHKHPKGGWTGCCTAEIDPTVERGGDIIRVDGMTWPGEVKLLAQHLRYASDGSPTVIGKATNFRKSSITFDGKPAKAILADIFFADSELAGKYKQLWPDFINEVSIGAMVDECEPLDKKNAFGGFDYTKTKGYELSVVTIPANPAAQVMRTLQQAFGDQLDIPDPAIKTLLEKIASSPLLLSDDTKIIEREAKRDADLAAILTAVHDVLKANQQVISRLDNLEDTLSSLPPSAASQDDRKTQQSPKLDHEKLKSLLALL